MINNINNRVNALSGQINNVRREAFQGVASAMALNIHMPNEAGKGAVGLGVATYGGETAIALAAKKVSKDGRFVYGGGVTLSGSTVGISASASFGF